MYVDFGWSNSLPELYHITVPIELMSDFDVMMDLHVAGYSLFFLIEESKKYIHVHVRRYTYIYIYICVWGEKIESSHPNEQE